MITLVLKREYGCKGYTTGKMVERVTGFSCSTMERRDPQHWRGIKNYCAIKEGTYKLKVYTRENLKLNLQLSMTGAYHNATLSGACAPHELPAGSICVGRGIDPDTPIMKGGDEVLDGIDQWIRQLMCDGHVTPKMKTGEIMLKVSYAEGYVWDEGKAEPKEEHHEEEQPDRWNFAE